MTWISSQNQAHVCIRMWYSRSFACIDEDITRCDTIEPNNYLRALHSLGTLFCSQYLYVSFTLYHSDSRAWWLGVSFRSVLHFSYKTEYFSVASLCFLTHYPTIGGSTSACRRYRQILSYLELWVEKWGMCSSFSW